MEDDENYRGEEYEDYQYKGEQENENENLDN